MPPSFECTIRSQVEKRRSRSEWIPEPIDIAVNPRPTEWHIGKALVQNLHHTRFVAYYRATLRGHSHGLPCFSTTRQAPSLRRSATISAWHRRTTLILLLLPTFGTYSPSNPTRTSTSLLWAQDQILKTKPGSSGSYWRVRPQTGSTSQRTLDMLAATTLPLSSLSNYQNRSIYPR